MSRTASTPLDPPRLAHPVPLRLGLWGPAFALLLIVWAMISLPTLVFVFFAMVPTVVSAIWDRSPDRHVALSVGGMNFAGMFPLLPSLWQISPTTEAGLRLLLADGNVALVYGAAAMGWLMTVTFPILCGAIYTFRLQRESERMRLLRDKLTEDWGDEVAGPSRAAG